MATLPLAWANRNGVLSDPLIERADMLIALSYLQEQIYLEYGVPPERIQVAPNFLPDDLVPADNGEGAPRDRWLYAGRLSAEKGVYELLEAWPDDMPIDVVGTGPLEGAIRGIRKTSIVMHGRIEREQTLTMMSRAVGLVFPSRWYEPFGLVWMEALACGTPILAPRDTAAGDLIECENVGCLLDEVTSERLRELAQLFRGMRAHCRSVFLQNFTEASFTERRLGLYQALQASR